MAEIINYPLKETEYIKKQTAKKAIVLHFTAGWPSPYQTIDIWNADGQRKGTSFVIGGVEANGGGAWDGKILQAFDSEFYDYHLFKWFSGSEIIEQSTIGIELCNWGPLTFRNGNFYTYANTILPKSQVVELDVPFKGYKFWHKFSDKQIDSLEYLLLFLLKKHAIQPSGLPKLLRLENGLQLQRMLNLQLLRKSMPLLIEDGIVGKKTRDALNSFPHAAFELDPNYKNIKNIDSGIYSHCTFDGDRKLDVHPAPNLIKMLKDI